MRKLDAYISQKKRRDIKMRKERMFIKSILLHTHTHIGVTINEFYCTCITKCVNATPRDTFRDETSNENARK